MSSVTGNKTISEFVKGRTEQQCQFYLEADGIYAEAFRYQSFVTFQFNFIFTSDISEFYFSCFRNLCRRGICLYTQITSDCVRAHTCSHQCQYGYWLCHLLPCAKEGLEKWGLIWT